MIVPAIKGYFFMHLKRRSLFKWEDCTPLRAPCGHTGGARSVFRHAHVAPENGSYFISPLQRRNSARLRERKKRSQGPPTKIRYHTLPCLVNALALYRDKFSPFHKNPWCILDKTPSWKPPIPVLYYNQGKGESHVRIRSLSKEMRAVAQRWTFAQADLPTSRCSPLREWNELISAS